MDLKSLRKYGPPVPEKNPDGPTIKRPSWPEVRLTYRACDLCLRGHGLPGIRTCGVENKMLPVEQHRAKGGACGPEAKHLDLPSWQLPKTRNPHL